MQAHQLTTTRLSLDALTPPPDPSVLHPKSLPALNQFPITPLPDDLADPLAHLGRWAGRNLTKTDFADGWQDKLTTTKGSNRKLVEAIKRTRDWRTGRTWRKLTSLPIENPNRRRRRPLSPALTLESIHDAPVVSSQGARRRRLRLADFVSKGSKHGLLRPLPIREMIEETPDPIKVFHLQPVITPKEMEAVVPHIQNVKQLQKTARLRDPFRHSDPAWAKWSREDERAMQPCRRIRTPILPKRHPPSELLTSLETELSRTTVFEVKPAEELEPGWVGDDDAFSLRLLNRFLGDVPDIRSVSVPRNDYCRVSPPPSVRDSKPWTTESFRDVEDELKVSHSSPNRYEQDAAQEEDEDISLPGNESESITVSVLLNPPWHWDTFPTCTYDLTNDDLDVPPLIGKLRGTATLARQLNWSLPQVDGHRLIHDEAAGLLALHPVLDDMLERNAEAHWPSLDNVGSEDNSNFPHGMPSHERANVTPLQAPPSLGDMAGPCLPAHSQRRSHTFSPDEVVAEQSDFLFVSDSRAANQRIHQAGVQERTMATLSAANKVASVPPKSSEPDSLRDIVMATELSADGGDQLDIGQVMLPAGLPARASIPQERDIPQDSKEGSRSDTVASVADGDWRQRATIRNPKWVQKVLAKLNELDVSLHPPLHILIHDGLLKQRALIRSLHDGGFATAAQEQRMQGTDLALSFTTGVIFYRLGDIINDTEHALFTSVKQAVRYYKRVFVVFEVIPFQSVGLPSAGKPRRDIENSIIPLTPAIEQAVGKFKRSIAISLQRGTDGVIGDVEVIFALNGPSEITQLLRYVVTEENERLREKMSENEVDEEGIRSVCEDRSWLEEDPIEPSDLAFGQNHGFNTFSSLYILHRCQTFQNFAALSDDQREKVFAIMIGRSQLKRFAEEWKRTLDGLEPTEVDDDNDERCRGKGQRAVPPPPSTRRKRHDGHAAVARKLNGIENGLATTAKRPAAVSLPNPSGSKRPRF